MAATREGQKTVEQVLKEWRTAGIRYVRFELPDMHGTSRSKLVPIDHVERYAREGLNMYGGAVVLDSRSDIVPGTLYNEEVAYADQLLRPDPATAACSRSPCRRSPATWRRSHETSGSRSASGTTGRGRRK